MKKCETCRHLGTASNDAGTETESVCIRFPPTAFNVVEREEQNGDQKSIWWKRISAFPPIRKDWICGEWTAP